MLLLERVVEVFLDVSDTLVDDFDLIEFLQNVTEHTARITGASSVGLMLANERGTLTHLAGSTPDAARLEAFQVESSQGPCVDSYHSGEPVITPDLRAARDRWPDFVPVAARAGITSVHCFPMRLRASVIGSLNVFGVETIALEPDEVRVVQALADLATIALIQERAISAAATLTDQLQGALTSRVLIEQAKGVVAQSNTITIDEAFVAIRSHARRHQQRLTDLAIEITSGVTDPTSLDAFARRPT